MKTLISQSRSGKRRAMAQGLRFLVAVGLGECLMQGCSDPFESCAAHRTCSQAGGGGTGAAGDKGTADGGNGSPGAGQAGQMGGPEEEAGAGGASTFGGGKGAASGSAGDAGAPATSGGGAPGGEGGTAGGVAGSASGGRNASGGAVSTQTAGTDGGGSHAGGTTDTSAGGAAGGTTTAGGTLGSGGTTVDLTCTPGESRRCSKLDTSIPQCGRRLVFCTADGVWPAVSTACAVGDRLCTSGSDNDCDGVADNYQCACTLGKLTTCKLPGEPDCQRGLAPCVADNAEGTQTHVGTCASADSSTARPVNHTYCPNNQLLGSPCTQAAGSAGTWQSKCESFSNTCGFLYCIAL